MAVEADNDMVVNLDVQFLPSVNNVACQVYVRADWLRIARRVVVHHPTWIVIYLIFSMFFGGNLKVVPGFGSCA
jgi:hypothetical protein